MRIYVFCFLFVSCRFVAGCEENLNYLIHVSNVSSNTTFDHVQAMLPKNRHSITRQWDFGDFQGYGVEFHHSDACTAFLNNVKKRLLKRDDGVDIVAERDDMMRIQNVQRNPPWVYYFFGCLFIVRVLIVWINMSYPWITSTCILHQQVRMQTCTLLIRKLFSFF